MKLFEQAWSILQAEFLSYLCGSLNWKGKADFWGQCCHMRALVCERKVCRELRPQSIKCKQLLLCLFSTPVLQHGCVQIWDDSVSWQATLLSLALQGPQSYLVPTCSVGKLKMLQSWYKVRACCDHDLWDAVYRRERRGSEASPPTHTHLYGTGIYRVGTNRNPILSMNEACDKVDFLLFSLINLHLLHWEVSAEAIDCQPK